jgi:hypothetical protein
MAVPLSAETARRVRILFRGDERDEAERMLIEKCADNLPFVEADDGTGIERLRYAALKVSDGKISRLHEALDLAKIDWRNLLMEAGFGEDEAAHLSWLPADSST